VIHDRVYCGKIAAIFNRNRQKSNNINKLKLLFAAVFLTVFVCKLLYSIINSRLGV